MTTVISDLNKLDRLVRRAQKEAPKGTVGFHAGHIPEDTAFSKGPVFLSHTASDAEEWRSFQGAPNLHIVKNLSRRKKFIRTGKQYYDAWSKSGAFYAEGHNIFNANELFLNFVSKGGYTSVVVTEKAVAEFFSRQLDTNLVLPHYRPFTVILDGDLARIVATFPEGMEWRD